MCRSGSNWTHKVRWLALLPCLLATTAEAQCRIQTSGSNCVRVPDSQITPRAYNAGDILPRGEFNMLMNSRYYGLPRARDGWVYFRVDRDIMRVDLATMEILEIVTDEASRNF